MTHVFNRMKKAYSTPSVQLLIGTSIILFFTLIYIILTLNRYWQFQYFFIDNVLFHQALWSVSELKTPIITHHLLGRMHILGDHFHPVIFLLSIPLAVFKRNEIVFISMSILVGLGGYFGMLTGFKLVKSRLIIYTLLFAYFLYLGVQNSMIFGFHEIHFVPFFFFLMTYAFFTKRKFLYWIAFILLLLTKESLVGLFIGWGLFLILSSKKNWKMGLLSIIISIVCFLIVTRLVIPQFNDTYLYTKFNFPTNINDLFTSFIVPKEKITTFLVSISTFGFLPLLNIPTLPLVLQDFFIRFIYGIKSNNQYSLTFHYGIGLAPLLFFSSLWTVRTIEGKIKNRIIIFILSIIIITSTTYYHLFWQGRGAVQMVFNPIFYQITKDNASIWNTVKKVPKDGTIVTQNHLGTVLSDRDVYPFPKTYDQFKTLDPDYVVYDSGEEQILSNFIPLLPKEDFFDLINHIYASNTYEVYYHEGNMYILKKKTIYP